MSRASEVQLCHSPFRSEYRQQHRVSNVTSKKSCCCPMEEHRSLAPAAVCISYGACCWSLVAGQTRKLAPASWLHRDPRHGSTEIRSGQESLESYSESAPTNLALLASKHPHPHRVLRVLTLKSSNQFHCQTSCRSMLCVCTRLWCNVVHAFDLAYSHARCQIDRTDPIAGKLASFD